MFYFITVEKATLMYFSDNNLTRIQCDLLVTGIYLFPLWFFFFPTEYILGCTNLSQ